MKWDYLFTHTILQRGRNYYNQNKVSNLHTIDGSNSIQFRAIVNGSKVYRVSGEVHGGDIIFMDCTCPYARGGAYCKHMAAVLFAIDDPKSKRYNHKRENEHKSKKEDAQQLALKTRKIITPFSKASNLQATEHYQYFDIEKITKDFLIYDSDYQRAVDSIAKGNIGFKVEFGYIHDSEHKGMVGEAVYRSSRILFSRDEIIETHCDDYACPGHYSGYVKNGKMKEPCIHTLISLILLQKYLNENEIGDSTDLDALELLQAFRTARTMKRAMADGGKRTVILKPCLVWNNERYSLSFRIGVGKLYVLKDLTQLVSTVEGLGRMNLGKQCELDFRQDVFDHQSQRYYQLIKQGVSEVDYINSREYYHNYSKPLSDLKSSLDMYGSRLDEFFEISKGENIEYMDKSNSYAKSKPLVLQHKAPQISLTIKKDMECDNVFHGIKIEGCFPRFISTAHYQYCITDETDCATLSRITIGEVMALKPLYMLQTSGDVSIHVGRQKLAEFYSIVLPILRKCATIEEPDGDVIEAYLPPEVEFVFYLDVVDYKPVCRVEAKYGTEARSVFDWLKKSYERESLRDELQEKEVIDVVQHYFPELDADEETFNCDDNEETAYSILESGVSTLMEYGEVQSTNRFQALRIRKKTQIRVGVSVESSLLNLEISSMDISQDELVEVLNSYKLRKKYHRLRNGDFLNIDNNMAELSEMVDVMHINLKALIKGKMQIPAYRALYLDKMLEQCDGLYSQRDRHFKKLINGFKTVNDSDFEVPDSLQNIMRNYQMYGYKWLRTIETYGFGGILADDMGLGKTLQMISVLLASKNEGMAGTSLIVCPASLVYNWVEEFSRFAPQLSVGIAAGKKEERERTITNYQQWDVLVTSYDLLKRDIDYYEDKHFAYEVLDEAQYIKTHTTAAAKSVKVIQSRTRFALTGTPIENRLSELWSIFDYLMPGFLYGYETFKREMETPIIKKSDEAVTKQLRRMVAPFILRRLKENVLKELPDKIEEVHYARFSTQQQRVYDGQILKMKEILESQDEEGIKKNKIQILAELTRIRQICCDPSLIFEDYKGESAKRIACMDLVQSAIEGDHRILLFSQFTSMLELMEQDLQHEGIAYYKITGATPKKERMELVQRFNENKIPVFLISLKAGGTGLNLTGADVVIHYDPWWNIAAQNQATDRTHRIGQTKVVSVYKLIVKGSIEEKIQIMQQSKKDLADEILSGELGNIGSLSKEDLLQLIQ